MKAKVKKMREHWYRQVIDLCPACGSERPYKMRIYGKKPKTNTHVINQQYDYCIEYGRT